LHVVYLALYMLDLCVHVCVHADMCIVVPPPPRYVLSGIQSKTLARTRVGRLHEVGLSADNGALLSWSTRHPSASTTKFGSLVMSGTGTGARVWQYTTPATMAEVGPLTVVGPSF
jgi:hypothetical protein